MAECTLGLVVISRYGQVEMGQHIVIDGDSVEMDVCAASPGLDSLTLRGSVELAWTLLKGHLMLQDNYRLYTDIESTC